MIFFSNFKPIPFKFDCRLLPSIKLYVIPRIQWLTNLVPDCTNVAVMVVPFAFAPLFVVTNSN